MAQTLPTAAALQQSGLLDLNRDGLKLRIAECFAPSGDSNFANRHYYPPPPFPLDDYIMLIQMRDMRKGGLRGVVCFSSSGVLTQDVLTESDGGAQHLEHDVGIYRGLHGFQRFNNQVELAEDAESDSSWADYCADKANNLREQPREILEAQRLDDDSMSLYVVLVRRSDGAVHQLVCRMDTLVTTRKITLGTVLSASTSTLPLGIPNVLVLSRTSSLPQRFRNKGR